MNEQLCAANQSLAGYRCPYCKRSYLIYDIETQINTCPGCKGEVVTEQVYQAKFTQEGVALSSH